MITMAFYDKLLDINVYLISLII